MIKRLTKSVAIGVLSLSAAAPAVQAGSVTQPGETVGLALGAPLPRGFYVVNTLDWGCRDTDPNSTCVGVDIPIVIWSTPWTLLGARVEALIATPLIEVGVDGSDYRAGFFNPLLATRFAWDLGNGFGVSYLFGAYIGVNSDVAFDSTSINQRVAFSYTANGLNLTAHAIYGIQLDDVSRTINPDFLNLDLTATKRFGKWEFGPVGYGSTDLNEPIPGYRKQRQFALGGLVGYDFGPVLLQFYLTTEVYEEHYGGKDTRGWFRFIIPFGEPAQMSRLGG